jgi:hypothetical protein
MLGVNIYELRSLLKKSLLNLAESEYPDGVLVDFARLQTNFMRFLHKQQEVNTYREGRVRPSVESRKLLHEISIKFGIGESIIKVVQLI